MVPTVALRRRVLRQFRPPPLRAVKERSVESVVKDVVQTCRDVRAKRQREPDNSQLPDEERAEHEERGLGRGTPGADCVHLLSLEELGLDAALLEAQPQLAHAIRRRRARRRAAVALTCRAGGRRVGRSL